MESDDRSCEKLKVTVKHSFWSVCFPTEKILGGNYRLVETSCKGRGLIRLSMARVEVFFFQTMLLVRIKYILNSEPKDLSANKSRGT